MADLTQTDVTNLQTFLTNGDRGGFYYAYGQMVGSGNSQIFNQVMIQAQITTYGGLWGGAAQMGNNYAQESAGLDGYGSPFYDVDLDYFSLEIAQRLFDAIEIDVDNGNSGIFTADEIQELDYSVWLDKGMGHLFPGNAQRGTIEDGIPADSVIYNFLTPNQSLGNRWGFTDIPLGMSVMVSAYADDFGRRPEDYGFSDYSQLGLEQSTISDDGQFVLERDALGYLIVRSTANGNTITVMDPNANLGRAFSVGNFVMGDFSVSPIAVDVIRNKLGVGLDEFGIRSYLTNEYSPPTYDGQDDFGLTVTENSETGKNQVTMRYPDQNGNANVTVFNISNIDENGNYISPYGYSTFTHDENGVPHIDGISLVPGAAPSSIERLEWDITIDPNTTDLNDLINSYEVSGPVYDSQGNIMFNPDGTPQTKIYASSNDAMSAALRADVLQDLSASALAAFKHGWISLPDAITSNPNFASAIEGVPDSFHMVKFDDGSIGISLKNTDSGAQQRLQIVEDSGGNLYTIRTTKHGDIDVITTTLAGGTKSTDVFLADTKISFGQTGSIFGSAFTSLIHTDNIYEQVGVSTVFSLVGKELFQTIGFAAINGKSLGDALELAFDDLGVDLQNAAIGAVSSILSAELINVLGLTGVAGDLANSASSAVINQLITNLVTPNADIFAGLDQIKFSNIFGAYAGSKLADAVYTPDNQGGQIGGQIGAGWGAYSGATVASMMALNPVVGAIYVAWTVFINKLIFSLIGSLFGGTARSAADVIFNPETQQFGVTNVWSKKGGSKEAAQNLADTAANALNGILMIIGGDVLNSGRISGGTYGLRGNKNREYTYRTNNTVSGDPGKQTISKSFKGDDGAGLLLEHGVLNALKNLQIAGGDIYIKRAVNGTLDQVLTGSTVNSDIQGEALNAINGNILIARDYRKYIENTAVINAINSGTSDLDAGTVSEFAAGWLVTIQRAQELGLNKRHVSDWLGGYKSWAESNGVNSFGQLSLSTTENYFRQTGRDFIYTDSNGFNRRIYDTVLQGDKDVISGTLGADVITLTDDVLTGDISLSVNGEISDGRKSVV